ncbi:MAG: hypothetical protein HYS81_02950 [Candidatus Aenigmatarchaeota archaeon]|nr:MAG: hypothetical protein HYS81_02950 [Candidatus Aenigmarchaeota archaeon]
MDATQRRRKVLLKAYEMNNGPQSGAAQLTLDYYAALSARPHGYHGPPECLLFDVHPTIYYPAFVAQHAKANLIY